MLRKYSIEWLVELYNARNIHLICSEIGCIGVIYQVAARHNRAVIGNFLGKRFEKANYSEERITFQTVIYMRDVKA